MDSKSKFGVKSLKAALESGKNVKNLIKKCVQPRIKLRSENGLKQLNREIGGKLKNLERKR